MCKIRGLEMSINRRFRVFLSFSEDSSQDTAAGLTTLSLADELLDNSIEPDELR